MKRFVTGWRVGLELIVMMIVFAVCIELYGVFFDSRARGIFLPVFIEIWWVSILVFALCWIIAFQSIQWQANSSMIRYRSLWHGWRTVDARDVFEIKFYRPSRGISVLYLKTTTQSVRFFNDGAFGDGPSAHLRAVVDFVRDHNPAVKIDPEMLKTPRTS